MLVLSNDALAAALLGALIEMEGGRAAFANAGESPRDAVRRLRPGLVFVDCDNAEACRTAFIGPAKMMGAAVVLFGPRGAAQAVRAHAETNGTDLLLIPPAPGELRAAIARGATL